MRIRDFHKKMTMKNDKMKKRTNENESIWLVQKFVKIRDLVSSSIYKNSQYKMVFVTQVAEERKF